MSRDQTQSLTHASRTATHGMLVLVGLAILAGAAVVQIFYVQALAIPLSIGVFLVTFVFLPSLWNRPFHIFLLLLLLWPLLPIHAVIQMPLGIPDIYFERAVILMLMAVIGARVMFLDARWPKPSGVATAFFLVVVAWQLRIAVFGSMAEGESSNIVTALIPPLVYLLTLALIESRRELLPLAAVLLATVLLISLTGLIDWALNREFSLFDYTIDGEPIGRMMDAPGGRAAGVMRNPGIYGATLGFGALLGICFLLNTQSGAGRLGLAACIAVLMFGVAVSFTRGAWLSVLLGLMYAQYHIKPLRKPFWALVAIAAVGLGIWSSDLLSNDVVQSRLLDRDNVVGRFDRILFGWNLFLEKPIFGWGHGSYNWLMANSRQLGIGGFDYSHNALITMFVDGGLVYTLCFLALLFYWLSKAHTLARDAELPQFHRSLAVAMGAFLVMWQVTALTIEVRYFAYFNALFWLSGAVIELLDRSAPAPDEVALATQAQETQP